MAFTTNFRVAPAFGTNTKIYNFDGQVRTFAGGGNRIDVMLLQALFHLFYYEINENANVKPPPKTTGPIKVDGIVGPQTRIHIEHFQQFLLKNNLTATTDGVMDPFKKQGILSPHTKKPFQLVSLNGIILSTAMKMGFPELHQDMINTHRGPIYPDELRAALRTPRALT
jgi:hypothetical protein